ncbi:MAG: hypothetical protein ACR2M1_16725 [Gemmatimonadaceae bacterium]
MVQSEVRVICGATIILLGTAAVACSSATAPPLSNGSLVTDASSYVARPTGPASPNYPQSYTFAVISRFTNMSADTIYLGRCFPRSTYPLFGVALADTSMAKRSGYDPAWGCVGHDQQFAIAPRDTRVDTLQITGPTAVDGVTHQALGMLEGRFHLTYEVQGCRGDDACRIDGPVSRSNEFTVRLSSQ